MFLTSVDATVYVCGQQPCTAGYSSTESECWQHSRWMKAERRLCAEILIQKAEAPAGDGTAFGQCM